MADWYIRFFDRTQGVLVGEYSLMTPTAEIRNSEPGGFTGEIGLGQLRRGSTTQGITRDEFAPYRTNYQLWRQSTGNGICISEGMLTSLNFNFNRDTALIGGKDWIHYMQRRIYPFDPQLYLDGGWRQWPRQWPDVEGFYGPRDYDDTSPIDLQIIIREIFLSMKFDPPEVLAKSALPRGTQWPTGVDNTAGVPNFSQNIPPFEETSTYKILPGDQTSIYDHIRKLSEQSDKGFEFDITPIDLEFRVWTPRRDSTQAFPWYLFHPSESEIEGAITEFDWTNEGPEGTYLVGLGAGRHKTGAVWTDVDNVAEFGRLDKLYDYGEVSDTEVILQMLKDQNDLHPQKKLSLALLNPEFLPLNFYTGGRPRNLIGARISAQHDFAPLHMVDADFRINAIKWSVDNSTNETVNLELEMVYEP